jgi:hypothetical protein
MTIFLLSHDSRTGLWLSVGRSENCYWPSPAQSFMVPSATELVIVFYCFTTMGILYYCVTMCCRRDVFTVPLPNNDLLYSFHYSHFQTSCHIAPSLRLLVPNCLQAYHCYFSEGACLWRLLSPSWRAFPRRAGPDSSASLLDVVQPYRTAVLQLFPP